MKAGAPRDGFTLLELLVTLSIVAGIITVVLACFEGGFRVYARIRDFGSREAEVYLAGEMLERDLSYLVPAATYRLGQRELQFSTVPFDMGRILEIQLLAPVTGGLSYRMDGQSMLSLVPDDLDVTFAYAQPDRPDVWLSEWSGSTNLPSAVRMFVRGDVGDGVVERTIVLVTGRQEKVGE